MSQNASEVTLTSTPEVFYVRKTPEVYLRQKKNAHNNIIAIQN